jgi:uncharacterized membrane protein
MRKIKDKFHLSSWRELPYWLKFLIIITLVLGILFRLVNLDKKIYWYDETITSMRVSGYAYEINDKLFTGNIINLDALMKYQRIGSDKSFIDTIKSVATVPEHPPFYYLIARFWSQLFGTSITAMRSLTALISLLIFPSIYWLSWELFQKASVGWIAIALVAVSPLHILYAQEAREYSLWTVTVILSSAAFLHALRLETRPSWRIYVVSMILGFYTHSFSVLLAIGQGIYLVFREGLRWSKTWKNYILSSLGIMILWLPWFFVFLMKLPGHRQRLAWSETNLSKPALIQKLFLNSTRGFIDFSSSVTPSFIIYIASVLVFILVSYSIYIIIKDNQSNPNKIWLFLLLLILVIPLTLFIPDFIFGGIRSTANRYLIPSYIDLHLAVAYLINSQITMANTRQRTLGKMLIAILLSCGVLSSAMSFSADCWWNKSFSCGNISVANIVNLAPRPLIISNSSLTNMNQILSLSYRLKPEVKFLLINRPNQLKIPQGFSDLFLYNPSDELRAEIDRSRPFDIQSVYQGKYLKLEKLVPPK